MHVFSIFIPFKGSQSLAKMTSKVTAESYLHGGVNDSAVPILATFEAIILANTTQYARRVKPVNQVTRWV
jgi:hypothetical protein